MDFIGKLLPGYLAVTLYLSIFNPDLLFNPDRALSFDLFSAVVFIIAGPAVGLTLQQLHRSVWTLMQWSPREETRERRKRTCRDYAFIRLNCTEAEMLELDKTEANCDFLLSTGLVMVLLSAYYIATKGVSEPLVPLGLVLLSIIFFLGGYVERKESYTPVYMHLESKYLGAEEETALPSSNES